ncbi:interleukin-11 receptor subunit alpha [Trematomus bernacchii]|uniref:interleukin-11 receptor subunit alpha n=1 Tax=Trematomus bernacchii TaxID=40690 RepID=UPI00146DA75F|nr:interleukin-11 receptor subunit alpha [Trematomus bernacchii]
MPGLLSSPVCLTVIWFLSWSLRPIRAQIQPDEVSGVQYALLESNVTLACRKSQIRTPVVWHHNNSAVLPWHKVTSDGTLVLLHVDLSAQGNYSCYDNGGLLLHSVKLRLGHRPGSLSISCQVPNHTHVRCSWVESVKTFLPAQYNAILLTVKGQEPRTCVVDVFQKHCDIVLPAYWSYIQTLSVQETNALGSETTYARMHLHKLLKPNPPQSVLVNELEGFPKRLNISWELPSSWPQSLGYPLLFHIRYRPEGFVHWSNVLAEHSPVVILDALAGRFHEVQVCARDEPDSESLWSEWTAVSLCKPWEGVSSPDPTEVFPTDPFPEPETSTTKTDPSVDEGNLGLVILLVLFSVVILTTVLSLIFVVWVRQRRRNHVTKQQLSSMVKMKSMPI